MPESPSQLLADQKSFGILVRQHHRELLIYTRALTGESESAQDIVQEAFVSAYHKIDEFDLSRDFGTWVRGFVRNRYREWVRRKVRRKPVLASEAAEIEAVVADWQTSRIASGSAANFANSFQKRAHPLRGADRPWSISPRPAQGARGHPKAG